MTMRILIAEDDDDAALYLSRALSRYGTCDRAVTGREAVSLFRDRAEDGDPHALLLMDIMMPVMDGQEALKAIRDVEEELGLVHGKRATAFMTTALDDPDNIWRAHFDGLATGYFAKPIRVDTLLRRLRDLDIIPPAESA